MSLESCFWHGDASRGSAADQAIRALAGGASGWLEIEEDTVPAGHIERVLRRAAPAVLVLECGGVVALEKIRGRAAVLLAPDGRRVRIPLETLHSRLTSGISAAHEAGIAAILDDCGIRGRRRERARRALLKERFADTTVCAIHQLRTHPGSSFGRQLREAGLLKRLAAFSFAHLIDYGLWLLAWIAIGGAALGGRVDSGGLWAWGLLLAAIIPIRLWVAWCQGVLAIGVGGLIKQRLLAGALNLDADALRSEGVGRMLSRTLEAEAMESLALSGGLAALLAFLELSAAGVVLWFGAGEWRHAALLALWVVLSVAVSYGYVLRRSDWTRSRLAMTHELVERMTGHRTRLTQEPPEQWHQGEDDAMSGYARDSKRMDRLDAVLSAAVPRGWELAAVALLLVAWTGGSPAPASLAIAIGGTLLAGQSLRRLSAGLAQLAGAGIAWREVAPLFRSAAQRMPESTAPSACGEIVLDAVNLTFRYRREGAPILEKCNLRMRRGDFVLLEGESGSGKSTLASLIAGLRKPESGMLLACGLDLHSLGERGWRGRIAAAPQYHENHVLSAPMAFNLLMGRKWPPKESDLLEAESVCRELGLGPLLERMPGGLMQMVGETGWQLSQGEKSRLFLARALLQGGDLIVLDESFAALDPETLRQSLECVFRRAETLLVVAHP